MEKYLRILKPKITPYQIKKRQDERWGRFWKEFRKIARVPKVISKDVAITEAEKIFIINRICAYTNLTKSELHPLSEGALFEVMQEKEILEQCRTDLSVRRKRKT